MDPGIVGICLVMSVAGAGLGLFSGLAPGIHVNTLAAMLLAVHPAIAGILPEGMGEEAAALAVSSCIMSASVVHSFVDFVPSVFIGAPDGEDAVSVLPGHRLLLQGRGMEAVRAAAIGSLIGASAAILMSVPLQWLLLHGLEDPLERLTPLVLIVACAVVVAGERRRGGVVWGTAVFAVSGMLGLACMTLEIPMHGIVGDGSVMMPLLTGLFGIPVLLDGSSSGRFPAQRDRVRDPVGPVPGLRGVLMGSVAGWFPGITSTVGASMSAAVFPETRPERFISTVASIGTVTSVLSLVTLSVSGNGRSGTALAIGEIAGDSLGGFMSQGFLVLLFVTAAASLMGYWMTVWSGRVMSGAMSGVDPGRMGRAVIVLLVAITFVLNGPWGLAVLGCSTLVGLLTKVCGTGRMVLCGCLLLPVLMFEFGYRGHSSLAWALDMNLASSTTNLSWVPEPISPLASQTATLNTSLLLSTSTSSVVQVADIPTGVAAEWATSRCVPTVLDPSSRKGATLSLAVASMSAIIAGVAKTGSVPLPSASAVLFCVTSTVFSPLMPVVSMRGRTTVSMITLTPFIPTFREGRPSLN